MNIVDFTLKTTLGFRQDPPLVFTTNKTLHERFTPQEPRCVFIVNCGYIPPSEFSSTTKERLVFPNRRCIDVNERFSFYRSSEFKEMESKRLENRKRLEHELRSMAKKRRTVIEPSKEKSSDKKAESSKKSGKRFTASGQNKKSISSEKSYCSLPVSTTNIVDKAKSVAKRHDSVSTLSSFFNSPVSSNKFYEKFKSFSRPNLDDTSKNLYRSTPVSSSQRYDRFKCFARNDADGFGAIKGTYDANGYYNVIERSVLSKRLRDVRNTKNVFADKYSESLKFPEKYEYFKNRGIQKPAFSPYHFNAQKESLYRWKRQPVTKEQLDDELDRYMSEVKFKPPTAERDDVNSFVEEYLLETEKYLNQIDSMDTFD